MSNIRTNLLDFLLEIKREYSSHGTETIAEEKVNTIFNMTVQGDGNVINTGNHSSIQADIKIDKGNFENLRKFLEKSEVATEDVTELETIIANDNPNHETKSIGSGVTEWMKKVLVKSIDIGSKIGTGISAKLLVDAIGKYYGWTQ